MLRRRPSVEDFGGWYLRGDIGFSNQRVRASSTCSYDTPATVVVSQTTASTPRASSASASAIKFNNWFRADVTGEYRGKRELPRPRHRITYQRRAVGTDTYHATKNEWLVLANAYVDLGTWWCITPFIGAGIGGARIAIIELHRAGVANNGRAARVPGLAYGDNARSGISPGPCMPVLPTRSRRHFTDRTGLSLRSIWATALTGDMRTFDGINAVNNPMTFKSITSHDLKLGVRWDLIQPAGLYAPPPLLIRKRLIASLPSLNDCQRRGIISAPFCFWLREISRFPKDPQSAATTID